MASSYTNLGLEKPLTGEQAGQWGDTVNDHITSLLDQAVSGYVNLAVSSGTTTITIPDGGSPSTGVARNMCLRLTGTGGGTLEVPVKTKLYFIYNNTGGGAAVTVKVTGQTGVAVPDGAKMVLVCNGTDVISAVSHFSALTLAAALPVASGGTGGTTASTARANITPLTTKGDLWGFSSVDARVPRGNDGDVLLTDSAQTLGVKWGTASAAGSSLVLIGAPQVASTYASVDFTYVNYASAFDGTYDDVIFPFVGVQTDWVGDTGTGGDNLWMRMGTGAGPTWNATASYGWQCGFFGYNTGVANDSSALAGYSGRIVMGITQNGNMMRYVANYAAHGQVKIRLPSGASFNSTAEYNLTYNRNADGAPINVTGSGQYGVLGALTGIRFGMIFGNIKVGTFYCYGVKKS